MRSFVSPSSVLCLWSVLAMLVGSGGCTFARTQTQPSGGGGSGGGGPGGSGPGSGGSASGSGGSGGMMPPTPCENLQCKQSTCQLGNCTVPACPAGARTTVSGTIFDPAGKVPLYNITVFVPNKALAPLVDGPSCDPCDPITGTSLLSGQPIAITKTDTAGKFTLGGVTVTGSGDVPAGANIPLVIQVGKWRREITVPNVQPCMDNPITDMNLTRLPRNQAEGHIPKMALTTGQADAMECLLRKVGIADEEFTPEGGAGRINLYAGGGGSSAYMPTLNAGAIFTPANPWWDSLDNLKKYDIVLHSCEGGLGSFTENTEPTSVKSQPAREALQAFADLGGRVFASHWHVYWFEKGTPAFQSIATFTHRQGLPNPYDATIDQTFPKGVALAQWMVNVQGSVTPGIVSIAQNANQRTVDAAAGGLISQRWIFASTLNPNSVQFLSATTPIPNGQCGRAVLSDLHVSAGTGMMTDIPAQPFPMGCVTTDLSPREKVLEFMLFDIASCVQPIVP